MLNRFRRVLFWCHLACGVSAGIVILIMSVTGVALTYQKEMQYWADTRHYRAAPPSEGRRATVEAIVAAVERDDPKNTPATITWRAEPEAPVAATIGARTLYLNPYTAEVYGEGTGQGLRSFFTTMTNWHRYLAMSGESRPTGKAITGAANLMFLFIVLSGMYLWWPKSLTWKQVRHVVWFRSGLRAKARDFNWHNAAGFWSALPLAVVVYSATVISYPWSNNLVYRAMGEMPPAPAAPRPAAAGAAPARPARAGLQIDELVDRARAYRSDWQMLALRVPASDAEPLVFTIDRGDAGQPHLRGTLTIDAYTGDVQTWEDFSTQTSGRRLRTFLRFAHTGEIFGLTGQTVAGVVSAGGALLVYTGVALAVRRFWNWRSRTY